MSRSNIAGGKNLLTNACLICSQVAITPGFKHSANLNEIGDVLVQIGPRTPVKLSVFDHREVMTFNGEVVSKGAKGIQENVQAAQNASNRVAETANRESGGGLVVARDEPAGSVGQPGYWLVPVKRNLIFLENEILLDHSRSLKIKRVHQMQGSHPAGGLSRLAGALSPGSWGLEALALSHTDVSVTLLVLMDAVIFPQRLFDRKLLLDAKGILSFFRLLLGYGLLVLAVLFTPVEEPKTLRTRSHHQVSKTKDPGYLMHIEYSESYP
ncbi:hypothetical protein Tco_0894875 [Tanacetum coccineum]|uniref:Uncharacterized protein n=1 Tax=Tanacetum coccineum TaxID=301880 RepID=A0ABQ5CE78_9ASTR